jgi:hypothetical protein
MNTGWGSPRSPLGYYSVINCDVRGTVSIDGIVYMVHGTGYHDHTWRFLYLVGHPIFMTGSLFTSTMVSMPLSGRYFH